MKILYVDDERIQRFVMKKSLEKMGYEVDLAEDGLEAIEKSKNNKYNLILMDLTMPKCDGFKASEEIRKFDKNVSIIAITSFGNDHDMMIKISNAGMNGLRLKPVRKNILKELLNNYLPQDNI